MKSLRPIDTKAGQHTHNKVPKGEEEVQEVKYIYMR